jgi:hypothetical protein
MKKATIISITAVLLIACVTGFTFWKINDVKEKKELAILADIAKIQESVNSLYKDEQKTHLADNIDQASIQSTHDLYSTYANQELSSQATTLLEQASLDINHVDNMFALKQSIDHLFDETGAIKEATDIDSAKSQLEALKSDKPVFAEELNLKLIDAETQIKRIASASTMVDALFTSPEKSAVKESIIQTEINVAKENVNQIKQNQAKNSLLSHIQVADDYLDAKIKAAAKAKAEAEAKAKAEAEAKAKAAAAKNNKPGKSSSSTKSDGTVDITGWYPYDTGDPATLLKYLLSGDVVKFNGQYYASPKLTDMLSNQEVVYFHDIAND